MPGRCRHGSKAIHGADNSTALNLAKDCTQHKQAVANLSFCQLHAHVHYLKVPNPKLGVLVQQHCK